MGCRIDGGVGYIYIYNFFLIVFGLFVLFICLFVCLHSLYVFCVFVCLYVCVFLCLFAFCLFVYLFVESYRRETIIVFAH